MSRTPPCRRLPHRRTLPSLSGLSLPKLSGLSLFGALRILNPLRIFLLRPLLVATALLALPVVPGAPSAQDATRPSAPAPEAARAEETPQAPALGTLSGLVRYAGSDPLRQKTFSNNIDVETCGDQVSSQAVRAGSKGALADVLVEVRTSDGERVPGPGIEVGAEPLKIELTSCSFKPRLLVVPLGSRVELRNTDGILHELKGLSLRNEPVHARLPRFRRRMVLEPEHFRRSERLSISCDRHSWSGAWWVATDNRYHAVTGADGRYAIEGLPPGIYQVTAWHGEFEQVESEAIIHVGETFTLDFELR